MGLKTIIFDFDGTLANCKELHQYAFRTAVEKYAPDCVYKDELIEGRPTLEKIKILNAYGANLHVDKVNILKQTLTQELLTDYIKYNKDVHNTIEKLSKSYKVCLASNATELFIYRSLDIMQIKDYFFKINTATEFPAKPDPITFYDCMRATGSGSATTLIVEDSEVGINCAKSTGANVCEVADVSDMLKKMEKYYA